MHRTLRQPAAKVAPARTPSTWKTRRGRGAEAAGAIVWRSFCTALYGRFVRRVGFGAIHLNSVIPITPRAGGSPAPRHGNQMIYSARRPRRPRDETRHTPGSRQHRAPRSDTVTRAHTWTRGISTQSRRACKSFCARRPLRTHTAHGDQTRTNHHQLKASTVGQPDRRFHISLSHTTSENRPPSQQITDTPIPHPPITSHHGGDGDGVHPLALPRAPARSPPPPRYP